MVNCPSCNQPIIHRRYDTRLQTEIYYCSCGWTEEDGGNYKAPEGVQLRLEGM